jgi:glycosyltransferase involved in cell wall biosynthesis
VADRPELTIAIASRDRPQLLIDVLRSIAGQRLDAYFFEVVVVLDGEDEGSVAACEEIARDLADVRKGLAFRVVTPWAQSRGLAAARNVCATEARGRFVRFQDDDDVLDPYAADAMVNAHFTWGPAVAVLGHTGIASHLLELPIMRYLAEDGGELFDYPALPKGPLDFNSFWGGRISVAANTVRAVRFDEELKFGAEDIEFAFRARQQLGLSVRYDARVRSVMIRSVDLEAFTRRCYQQGRSARYVATKHPRSLLEEWAIDSHAYIAWTGDAGDAFDAAFRRCRKLESAVDYRIRAGAVSEELVRILAASYRETFGMARALGFAEQPLPIG